MISSLVKYFNADGTPTTRGIEYFNDLERRLEALPAAPTATAGDGQWVAIGSAVGAALVLPAGGEWAYAAYRFNSGVVANSAFGVGDGGATVGAATGGQNWSGFAWRVS